MKNEKGYGRLRFCVARGSSQAVPLPLVPFCDPHYSNLKTEMEERLGAKRRRGEQGETRREKK